MAATDTTEMQGGSAEDSGHPVLRVVCTRRHLPSHIIRIRQYCPRDIDVQRGARAMKKKPIASKYIRWGWQICPFVRARYYLMMLLSSGLSVCAGNACLATTCIERMQSRYSVICQLIRVGGRCGNTCAIDCVLISRCWFNLGI
jgi:hypothetical protein